MDSCITAETKASAGGVQIRRETLVSRSPALMSDYSQSQEVHYKGQLSSTTQI